MKLLLILAIGLAAVAAVPYKSQRIVGGSITTIQNYPFATSVLQNFGGLFWQVCGGTIINNRSILSAAHCYVHPQLHQNWRFRVGSTNANSGGVVHMTQMVINHPQYNPATLNNDVSVIRIAGAFSFNVNVATASIAGQTYNVPDNAAVWAIGWGRTSAGGPQSEQLRHVQIWVVNLAVCRARYAEIHLTVTDQMLCSGWLDVGGRDQCQGDSGGPLLHNRIVVGVSSWGYSCAQPRFPGVNARVSSFTPWILGNA